MYLIQPPQSWKDLSTHYQVALHSKWYKIISELQNELVLATCDFYRERQMDFMLLPITTVSISSPMGLGSDSSPVKVKIQGIETYLADSMQFLLEFGCRINKKGTYYIAPSFRGELADKRHLCQFFHSEAEIPGDLNDVIKIVEDYIHFLVNRFKKNQSANIKKVAGTTKHLDDLLKMKSFPRCTFDEAVKILKNSKKYVESREKFRIINSLGEKTLMDHFGGYVWLTNFDHLSVPFYQKFSDKSKTTAKNADLLMGIGETVGSGERHLTGQDVVEALKLHKVNKKSYEWYIDMKEQTKLQTAGFGMGTERFFLWLLKHDDIRDMQLLPRFNGVPSKL